MTKQNQHAGRPKNLAIKGDVVRKLRDQHGWTQATLARKVNEEIKGRSVLEEESLQKKCRRWENEGVISKTACQALAKVLQTTEEHLRNGGAPAPAPDRVEELVRQIRLQLESGNKHTENFVDGVRELEELSAIPPFTDDDSAIRVAARALDARITSAQLTHNNDALKPLLEITGYSLQELLRPGSYHGLWMVASEGAFKHTTHLTQGAANALNSAMEMVEEWREGRSSDSRAILRDDKHWFRIYLADPIFPQLDAVISFVRFDATDRGLLWTRPTEFDRWRIVEGTADRLHDLFNYVRDFGDNSEWPDPKNMRLELSPYLTATESKSATPIARFKGAIEEHIDERLNLFQKEGAGHMVMMNWLGSQMSEDLHPFLNEWPAECWTAESWGQQICISLNAHYRISDRLDRLPVIFERKFSLRLVEEFEDGTVRHLPWTPDSCEEVLRKVKRAIEKLPTLEDAGYELIGPRNPKTSL